MLYERGDFRLDGKKFSPTRVSNDSTEHDHDVLDSYVKASLKVTIKVTTNQCTFLMCSILSNAFLSTWR